MSTDRYTVPLAESQWRLPGHETDVVFNWEYDTGRERMLALYEQGKDKQWNASRRIDWSIEVDMADQGLMPDYQVPIFGSPVWE
ncbi:MAG: aminobenzoate oxygenase, partial [Acidimicrobiia bacterium]